MRRSRGHDARRVPHRQRGDRRLGAREAGGRALRRLGHAERELLELPCGSGARRVGHCGRRPPAPDPAPGQRARDQDESEQRRREQCRPGAEQQHRLLAHTPHHARRGRRRAQRRDERGGREPGVERAARQIAMQPRDGLGGVEHGAPGERQGEQREQQAEVRPGVCVRGGQPAPESQRADPRVQEPHDDGGRAHGRERETPQPLAPRQGPEVVAHVAVQQRIGDAEPDAVRRDRGAHPPVPRAQRQQEAEHEAAGDGAGEQNGLRNGLDDFEIAEPSRQLHGSDRAVHEQQVAGAPPHGREQQHAGDEPREVPRLEIRAAAREPGRPHALRRLKRGPAPSDEYHHQQCDGDQQRPATGGLPHARSLWAASQPSTSAR